MAAATSVARHGNAFLCAALGLFVDVGRDEDGVEEEGFMRLIQVTNEIVFGSVDEMRMTRITNK
jgi:hypothetical protein